MLEKYTVHSPEERDRVLAVMAALDIIKASVSAPCAYAGSDKLEYDAKYAADHVAALADAIQAAINK